MKDLYHRLGLEKDAGEEELAAALESTPELNDYAAVLLDGKKRAGYDRTHATLTTIGALRHRLGLDSGDSWFLDNYPDFAPKNILAERQAATRAAQQEQSFDDPGEASGPTAPPVRKNGSNKAVIFVIAFIVILAVLAYLVF